MMKQRRMLFITLSNIGDLVMTTPLLEALHLSYPDYLIDVVADSRSSELLRACPYLGDIIHRNKRDGVGGTVNLIARLRERHYEIAVDLRTAFLTLLIRCGQRGQKRRGTSRGTHAVEHHFTALAPILGPDVTIPPARLWLDDASRANAAALLGGATDAATLVVAPGANWPGKIWPIDRYARLIDDLGADFSRVLVVGSGDDTALGEYLAQHCAIPVLNLAGTTGLLDAAACMNGAGMFIGNDSGLGHIAAALGIPTLTVFGPGRPARYKPWGERAAVVLAPDEDLEQLGPAAVVDALRGHPAFAHRRSSTPD